MGSGLLGIVSSLVGNIAHAKKQEQAEDDAYWQRMSLVMGAVMDNPTMPLPVQDQAREFYYDTLTKHAGKEGKEQAEQMNEFLKKALPVRKAVQKRQQEDATTQAMGAPAGPAALTGGADRKDLGLQTPQNTSYLPAFAGAPPTPAQPAPGPAPPPAPPPSADTGPSGPTYANAAGYLGAYPGGGQRRGGLLGALAGIGGGVQEALTGMPARHTPQPPGAAAPTTDPALRRYMAEQQLQQQQRQRDIQQRFQSGVAAGLKGRELYEWAYANKWPTQQRPSTAAPKTIPVLVDGKPATVREVTQADGTVKFLNAQNQEIDASKVSYAPPKTATSSQEYTGEDRNYLHALEDLANKDIPEGSPRKIAAQATKDKFEREEKVRAEQLKRQQLLTTPSLTEKAADAYAEMWIRTGKLPIGSTRSLGPATMQQIMNAIPRVAEAKGLTPGELIAMQSDTASLQDANKKMTVAYKQVESFEGTAEANLDMAMKAAQKIADTGSPLFNRPAREIEAKWKGDPNYAEWNTARTAAVSEISKILSGSMGNAAVSDSVRAETQKLLDSDYTLEGLQRAAETLRKDMANRVGNMKKTLDGIHDAIAAGGRPSGTGGGGAPAPASAARPAMGGYIVGHQYSGLTYLGGDPKDQTSWQK